jgi:hypothetical protein
MNKARGNQSRRLKMVMAVITGVVVGAATGNALLGVGAGVAWLFLVLIMDGGRGGRE